MPNRTSATQLMQGPRPAPLKVAKDSHAAAKKRPAQQPVIIYVESPKVVHAHPAEFKSVVQRLTGAAPSLAAPSPWTTTTMLFPGSPLPPPPTPQFRFEMYGRAQDQARNDGSCRTTLPPLVATSTLLPFASYGDAAAGRDLSYDQLLGSPFLQLDQNMAPPAACGGPSSVHVNLPVSCSPLALPSLGAGHGDLFINRQ